MLPWLRFAGKPSMTKPLTSSNFFISSPNNQTTSSWNWNATSSKISPAAQAKYMQCTDVCNKSPPLHRLENLNLLARLLSPKDHLPSEGCWRSIEVQCLEATDIQLKPPPKEIPRGKMPITKLACEQLALCALPSSWASLEKCSQKISQQPIH